MRPRLHAQPSSSDPGRGHLTRSKTCELAAIEEKDRFQEAPFLWRPPRKVPWQHITLSLRGPVLWIKKPLKDDFSPFFELINVSNVYMKKDVTTMRPPAPPSSSSAGAVHTLRRNTLQGAPAAAAAEMEEAKGKDDHKDEHEQKEIEAVEATKDKNNNNIEVPDVPKQKEENPAEDDKDKDEDENVDFTKKKKKSKKAKKKGRREEAQVSQGEPADEGDKKVDEQEEAPKVATSSEPPAAVVAEEAKKKEKDEKPENGQEGAQEENNSNKKKEEDDNISNKKLAKTTSINFGSVIRWANRGSLIVRPAGPPPDAVAYHTFVVEVRRKEFTLDVIPHTFACPDRAQAESWVAALQEAVIATRLERKRELEVEAGWLPSPRKMGNPSPSGGDDESSTDNVKNKEKEEDEEAEEGKELPEGTDASATTTTTTTTTATSTIAAGLMAPSMAGGLMTGMFAALPGETEKQWQRRRKQELQEELRERKRRGKAEAKLNLFGLAGTKGYPLEEHKVTTVDGYILTLYRIPHGRCETGFSKRPVVFLMHGLMDCSATWMINEPNKSLAFIFADNGFDVWMGNNRGNRFSREHTTLKVDSTQYWNFNRDDLVKDVRASIDYALDYTQQPHLVYAGHSQGCNLFLAMMSSLSEMRHKVSIGLLVAPAAFVHNQKSKMMTYLANMQTDRLFQFLGIKAFLATGSWLNNITPGLLLYSPQSVRLVTRIMFDYMCGWNPDNNFSLERLPVIAAHQPGGTSVMVMAHWAQSIRNHTFSRFDFGPKKNLELYQQEQAPPYDMSAVRDVKVAVFYGGEDKLTCKEDVEHLISLLPEETVAYVQYEQEYGHLDFVWGDDAHIRIYQKMVELAKEHYKRAEAERPQQEEKEVGEEDETEEATASSSSLTSSLSGSCSIEVVRTKEDAAEKDEPKSKLRRRNTDGLVKTKTKKKTTLRKGSKAADVKDEDEDEVEDEIERRHSVDGKAGAKNKQKKKNTLRRLLRLESHGGLEEAVDLRQDLSDA